MQKALILLIGLALGGGAGWLLFSNEEPVSGHVESGGLEELQDRLRQTRAAFERLQPPSSAEENALRRPQTPPYSAHLKAADSLGVEPVEGESDISAHLQAGELVPLAESEHYAVMVLEHSTPFVRPAMISLLDEIGQRFQAGLQEHGLPSYRFTVSSGTRTAELQSDLRIGNRNAAPGTSSHESGVSVDIVNFRYAYSPSEDESIEAERNRSRQLNQLLAETYRGYGGLYWDHLFGLMTRILADLQNEGRALVLLEAEQPVFHITVTQ